ncbi:MAG: hypothetical protein V2A56_05260 [bacterium]
MTLLQAVIILVAAGTLYGAGAALLMPPMRRGNINEIQTRILSAFALKLVLGIAWLLFVWKGLGWNSTVAAFGMTGAYLLALIAVTLTIANMLKRRAG